MGAFRDIAKHSAVYGIGQILSRLASIALLPVYTRYLSPADYGILALLDLGIGLLGVIVGGGIADAANRFHFRADSRRSRNRLWWTALSVVVGLSVLVVIPLVFLRETIAAALLGEAGSRAALFVLLALLTLIFSTVEQVLQVSLRVDKRSVLLVVTSLVRLALNVALNLTFLIRMEMGVAAILWGNLITGLAATMWLLFLFRVHRGAIEFDRRWLRPLIAFSGPLVVTALLAFGMHRADRYLLRLYLGLDQVGLYSVAYTIGHAVNTLVLLPFTQIWRVVIFELEHRSDARAIYSQVFRYFFDFLALFLFGVSLFAEGILRVLVAPEFLSAATLIPIVCLAYLFFSLNVHFNVPALLANRTSRLVMPSLLALVLNVVGNLLLIPMLGTYGAAWVSVVTFAALSFLGLAVYRRIDKYPYPLGHCGLVLVGLVGSYLIWQEGISPKVSTTLDLIGRAFVWLTWALILARPFMRSASFKDLLREVSAVVRRKSR